MSQYDLIIFDMDGTLYPNHEGFNAVYPRVVLELASRVSGMSPADTETRFREQMADLEAEIGGRPTWTLTLLARYDVSFSEFEAAIGRELDVENLLTPDPRGVESVERIAARYPLVLYTTNNGPVTERILSHLGFAHLFPRERRFTLSSVGTLDLPRVEQMMHVKPGERGFRHVLNQFDGRPAHTMMVGDSLVSDIEPARRLGMKTYRVTTPEDLYRLPEVLGC